MNRKEYPTILAYHSISHSRNDGLSVNATNFEKQLNWLKNNGYQSIGFSDLPKSSRKKQFIITFDDGYADNFNVAFPLLKKYGFTATLFITVNYIGTVHIFLWDLDKVNKNGNKDDYRLLTWEQVKEMLDFGFEIGSHTNTHPLLTEISEEKSLNEIKISRTIIKEKLNCDVDTFCYPAGNLNNGIIKQVKESGYLYGVITPPVSGIPISKYTLRRAGIYQKTTLTQFKLKMNPFIQYLVEKIKKRNIKTE